MTTTIQYAMVVCVIAGNKFSNEYSVIFFSNHFHKSTLAWFVVRKLKHIGYDKQAEHLVIMDLLYDRILDIQ